MSVNQDVAEIPGTALVAEQLLPDTTLTDARTGRSWKPSQLRQRAALVLCFLHAGCRPCEEFAAGLADREDAFRWADAQVRVVLPRPAASPLPVVLDADGQARARMLGPDAQIPTLVVADRYSAAADAYVAADHDFPDPEEIVKSVRLLACDCS